MAKITCPFFGFSIFIRLFFSSIFFAVEPKNFEEMSEISKKSFEEMSFFEENNL